MVSVVEQETGGGPDAAVLAVPTVLSLETAHLRSQAGNVRQRPSVWLYARS